VGSNTGQEFLVENLSPSHNENSNVEIQNKTKKFSCWRQNNNKNAQAISMLPRKFLVVFHFPQLFKVPTFFFK